MRIGRILRWAWLPVAVVIIAVGGSHGHRWAYRHVERYTGTTPKTLNCVLCHVDAKGGTVLDRLTRPRYESPRDIAVSPDGKRLYVTAETANALIVVDLGRRKPVVRVKVGTKPQRVILTPDGLTAFVSNEWDDSVSVVDLASSKVVRELVGVGDAPGGLALSPDGRTLIVANRHGNDIAFVNATDGMEVARLVAGSNPYDFAPTPDGNHLVAVNQLSRITTRPNPPESEIELVDVNERRIVARKPLLNGHLCEGVAVTPDGEFALYTVVRPKNLIPITQVSRGWVVTNCLGVLNLRTGEVAAFPLDELGRFFADPCDVAVTPDGRNAFVSHSGADIVSVVDLKRLRTLLATSTPAERERYANHLGVHRSFVVKRIPTAANPKGLAVSPDGKFIYVAERLADSVGVIAVDSLAMVDHIRIGGSRRESFLRRGERIFNSANGTFHGQFSCRSCHPDDHVDRLQYDFAIDGLAKNILDNRTLLGIDRTAPYKWNGKNTSLYMQCGMRFARVLTRSEAFPPRDLAALVGFEAHLKQPPNRYRAPDNVLTPAEQRGKEFYERVVTKSGQPIPERNRCVTCHPAPYFTDKKLADVGSASPTDTVKEFDAPQLNNIYLSAPYLHDGKAATLEEIWTRFNPYDTHGFTSDMTKRDLNDLIEYLKTL
jgi:YVTN family beta-propeller protein